MTRLERDVFPYIGERPIKEIKAPELLTVLRRIEARGTLELAHRIRTICGQVFRYSVATGRAERDPATDWAHYRRCKQLTGRLLPNLRK